MIELSNPYFAWVSSTVGPIIDRIPNDLGQSWVFWIVVWFFLVDPPILVTIFANRALASRHADILDEVGAFIPGSVSARRIIRISRLANRKTLGSSTRNDLSRIERWLWFGYVWQVLFWLSFLLVISYLITRS
jgi:hypothetical protein